MIENNIIDIKDRKRRKILENAIQDLNFTLTTTTEYLKKIEPVAKKYQIGYNIVRNLKPTVEEILSELRKCKKKLENLNE